MIHIKVWDGSRCARITEMVNAGKRGKVCRVLRFSGDACTHSSRALSTKHTNHILGTIRALTPNDTFEYAKEVLEVGLEAARDEGVEEWAISLHEETIKGIKAPRPPLTAGVEGKWSAGADESGIGLSALDDVNMWREITPHDQSPARAYDIAAKVWPRVQAAATLHEAADILRGAGAKLHGYCGMD